MAKLSDEFYAILKPTRRFGPLVNGQRPVREFKVERLRRGKPFTNANEVAVKLVIEVDSTLFDDVIPTANVTIGSKDLFVNTSVEVTSEPHEDEDAEVPED